MRSRQALSLLSLAVAPGCMAISSDDRPVVESVTISPSPAGVADTLTCSWRFTSPLRRPDRSAAEWTVNNGARTPGITLAGVFRRGDQVTCLVRPHDGVEAGVPVAAEATIANTPPKVDEVTLAPMPLRARDPVTCTWSGFHDDDGDPDLTRRAFSKNDQVVDEDTFPDFVRGDRIACAVTPFDGISEGASMTREVVVANTPPSATSLVIAPTPARRGDTLNCSYGFVDSDGDTDRSNLLWTVNDKDVGTGPSLVFDVRRGDRVACHVSPSDGLDSGVTASTEVTIENRVPTIDRVVITPDSLFVDSRPACTWEGFQDVDDDADLSSREWRINGRVAGTQATLDGGFQRGDVIECVVTPRDGMGMGDTRSAMLTVQNSRPVVGQVSITPEVPGIGDAMLCTASQLFDADGDEVKLAFAWFVNDQEVTQGPSLEMTLARGDRVACVVVPSDGLESGNVASATVQVANKPPSLASASIAPLSAFTDDTLTCSAHAPTDPEGDPVEVSFAWYVNDVARGSTMSLPGSAFSRGDVVRCEATPSDGLAAGPVQRAEITIGNSTPTVDGASILPSIIRVADTLRCEAVGVKDADGDSITQTVLWSINGSPAGTSPTLAGGLHRGDLVACSLTVTDSDASASPVGATVTVTNTPPSVDSVAILPSPALVGSALTCAPSGVSDADGDKVTTTIRWSINGVPAGEGATKTGGFARGDLVTCEVAPTDGLEAGAPGSTTVTIANSPPILAKASLSSQEAVVGTILTCQGTGSTDPDGDIVSVAYAWRVNGQAAGTGSTHTVKTGHDSVVECVATPTDGIASGDSVATSVVIANSVPTLTGASLGPSPAFVTSTLTCEGQGFSDPDGDAGSSTFTWTVNGNAAGVGSTLAGAFKKGDTVACEATPKDALGGIGKAMSSSLVIANSPPTITGATLSPNPANRTDTLTCAAKGPTDADGDPVTIAYLWTRNGSTVGSGTTLTGSFVRGDTVGCAATPSDPSGAGATQSTSLVVANAPPTVSVVALSPSPVYTNDTLTAAVTASDPDGDTLNIAFAWRKNGASVGSNSSTLAGTTSFNKGDSLYVTASASDPSGAAAERTSSSLVVSNSPPTAAVGSVMPATGYADDSEALQCAVSTAATDPDGDPLSYLYSWNVDTKASGVNQSTVGAATTLPGQTWECVLTASDGSATGPSSKTASVLVVSKISGNLLSSTTWTKAGAPYFFTAKVAVGDAAVLTIDPGARLMGNGFALENWGTVSAIGTSLDRIRMEDVTVTPRGTTAIPAKLIFKFAHFLGGTLYAPTGNAIYSNLILTDSIVDALESYMYLWYPVTDCTIERNIFKYFPGLSVGISGNVQVYVRNNVFYQQTGSYAVENWASYSTTMTWVQYNSFLSTDRVALRLPPGYDSTRMTGSENYWGGATDAMVGAMIFDKNDDLSCATTIGYTPTLASPHANTPDPKPWIP